MGKQIMTLLAKTMSGLEEVLANELEEIGALKIEILTRAVRFEGDLAVLYKANYCCRTALSILVEQFSFKFYSQEDFYHKILRYNWDPLFEHDTTFVVEATISGDLFTNSHYTALLCKDAIVDYFRNKYNQRPTVDRFDPHLRVNVYVRQDECTIYLDSSGESLFKRGYRVATGEAPIKEVLAAGIIKLAGWNGETNFYAPMCGSGTFAIEAAMIASKIPAGYYREQFGFMLWPNFDELLWKRIKNEADMEISESDIEIASVSSASASFIVSVSVSLSLSISTTTSFFSRIVSFSNGFPMVFVSVWVHTNCFPGSFNSFIIWYLKVSSYMLSLRSRLILAKI